MKPDPKFTELVQRAKDGDERSLNELARQVRPRLLTTVKRKTHNRLSSEDIVQEALMALRTSLNGLKQADQFWPWMFKIVDRRIADEYDRESRDHRGIGQIPAQPNSYSDDGLDKLIAEEIVKIVREGIETLNEKDRRLIKDRCFEKKSFLEIARVRNRNPFAVRMAFFRAKQALKKRLAQLGWNDIGPGGLLTALILFGKLTAPSPASAAQFTISPATLKVGTLAGFTGVVTTKLGLLLLGLALTLVTGAVTVLQQEEAGTAPSVRLSAFGNHAPADWMDQTISEQWFYYPGGADGPVMLRLMSRAPSPVCLWLSNDQDNYHFKVGENRVYKVDHNFFYSDLSVMRLPTDSPELTARLDAMEGDSRSIPITHRKEPGLLVTWRPDAETASSHVRTETDFNLAREESLYYPWADEIGSIDARDAMHQRGWTFFQVKGQINGKSVEGTGQMPFVAAAQREHHPWLHMHVGRRRYIDTPVGAMQIDADGTETAYPTGSFFAGLARPWMGLHAVDTVRRDAAEKGLSFRTQRTSDKNLVEINIPTRDQNLVYTIDLERDVVTRITYTNNAGQKNGELNFAYLESAETTSEFTQPRMQRVHAPQKAQGMLWLTELK